MRLDGAHHITMITADAQRCVDFHAGVLGLRLIKTTVNFDRPSAYHLYFGDESGTPGSILTWFEFPGVAPGRAGAGMIHTITLAVSGSAAVDFWERRLDGAGVVVSRIDGGLRFRDPDGLAFELVPDGRDQPPLIAVHPEVPAEHAIAGLRSARAYAMIAAPHDPFLAGSLGFEARDDGSYRVAGEHRIFDWAYEPGPPHDGVAGSGTVHHIAWACRDEEELLQWQSRVREVADDVTDVRDRDYFRSIYFHEPRGVLFEIATVPPGFGVDEDPDHLGEALRLPARHEHLRAELERSLTPLVNPRA